MFRDDLRGTVGTEYWMAPESTLTDFLFFLRANIPGMIIVLMGEKYDFKVDVYSYGFGMCSNDDALYGFTTHVLRSSLGDFDRRQNSKPTGSYFRKLPRVENGRI